MPSKAVLRSARSSQEKRRSRAGLLGIAGLLLFNYGIAACQHSRGETLSQRARIVDVYHPWAIALGPILLAVAVYYGRRWKTDVPNTEQERPVQKFPSILPIGNLQPLRKKESYRRAPRDER